MKLWYLLIIFVIWKIVYFSNSSNELFILKNKNISNIEWCMIEIGFCVVIGSFFMEMSLI